MHLASRASTSTWGPTLGAASTAALPRGPRRMARGSIGAPHGGRLGVYEVKRLLGEGGMARVFLADHTVIDRPVAIKRLLPELGHLPAAHALFLREARIAGSIRHPNLLEIYDFGYDPDGRPYYVMELARGETLADRLVHGPLMTSQALDIAIAVADAVAAVHREGYLHRDIKAENVMLARDERRLVPKLIDFGIACRIDGRDAGARDRDEGIAGTPRVMAPEQVARDTVDERTDIWGLGVLLHEMLTARRPFERRGSLREDLLAIVTEAPQPVPAHVPAGVRAIVAACLSKDPDGRPATAAMLAARLRGELAAYLAERGLTPRRDG